jgi:D-allose transport system ATP-binding protein
MTKLIEVQDITKEFPGVVALDDISFDLNEGEVHVLVGENGAGKSTLMKILSGVYTPTSGNIIINGKTYTHLNPTLSQELGISIIYQELSVINELSIAENLFIGRLPTKQLVGVPVVDWKYINRKAAEMLEMVGLDKSPSTIVQELSISEKQLVEIAKALVMEARVLIMDEPTSSLTPEEIRRLFKIIRNLRDNGVGVIYISHKLDEINQVGDRVTVLKDGKLVGSKDLSEVSSKEEIVLMMVGRELKDKYFSTRATSKEGDDDIIFEARNISTPDNKVKDVSFKLHRHEILGFAGLMGAGRTELMNAIFGAEKKESGEIFINGEEIKINDTYDAVRKGLALLTENRRETGFFHNFEIFKNVSIVENLKHSKLKGATGLINGNVEKQKAETQKEKLSIKCTSINQNITKLSGGNQQKVIIGKWLCADAEVILFDEPTRGIDVGSKSEIYKIMRQLVDEGKGVIMVSSELPELLSVCDRILVFRKGEISARLTSAEATEEKIILAAT